MTERTPAHGLQVATELYRFIEDQVLPGTGIASAAFWAGFDQIVADLAPKNAALLAERDRIQAAMDSWHRANPGPITDMAAYQGWLRKIGYLVDAPADVQATTANVDAELALQAGPQLVVPIMNARYALNAANARWGSLYDALYGTDAISEDDGAERAGGYNPVRGAKVIAFARKFLDDAAPLVSASHSQATGYAVEAGQLVVKLAGGMVTSLTNPAQFAGYQGDAANPSSILLVHNGLHVDIRIDRSTPIGASDAAGVADLVLEAALSTILDLEDSVAAVDAQDKVLGYSNWLGIQKGTLTEDVAKGGKHLQAQPQRRPPLHRPGAPSEVRLHGRSAAVRAQRRPPDDQPGHPLGRRGTVARFRKASWTRWSPPPSRCTTCRAMAASNGDPQLAPRQRLHRQAEDARPGRSGLRLRAVRPRGAGARPARQHRQARHHGRGAPHQRQPQGLHRRRGQPRGLHQHRLPRPHRRRDAHRHARRPDDAQGRHQEQRLDRRPTRRATCSSACSAACAAGPRSARACGPCPT
jgi:hypothetical protein